MSSIKKWHLRFLDQAKLIASWSKDTTQVGAVIVSPDRRILSMGYNGFPSGCKDNIAHRQARPTKYLYTEHAERNAIYNAGKAGVRLQGSTLYCTMFPCADCARGIIQSGIQAIVVERRPDFENPTWGKSFFAALDMFKETNVNVIILEI